MDRRQFLRAAKLTAASALASGPLAAAERHPVGAPVMRRFNEQRWALDNIIQANGIDWDQGRTPGMIRYCGAAVVGDMAVSCEPSPMPYAVGTTVITPSPAGASM